MNSIHQSMDDYCLSTVGFKERILTQANTNNSLYYLLILLIIDLTPLYKVDEAKKKELYKKCTCLYKGLYFIEKTAFKRINNP